MMEKRQMGLWYGLIAVVLTIIVMFPVLNNQWLNWDDGSYVLDNRLVQDLSWEQTGEIFHTPAVLGLYHPLTLLSYSVDYAIWEREAFGFHLTNLLLHLLNVSLLLLFIFRLTAKWPVAFVVALLFGMHPMHVESVAWISTRKDVLYTTLFLMALLAYLRYLEYDNGKKWRGYIGAILCFGAALLSKGIAFVLPLILFLIDYYQGRSWNWKEQILEKIPFIFLMIVGLYVAGLGQSSSESLHPLADTPFYNTIFIGIRNVWIYILKAIIPWNLCGFHPFPFMEGVQIPSTYYLALIPMLGLLYALYWSFLKEKRLFFGLAFFLICIGPLSQVIPFGKAVMAERYTYMAYIGLFFLFAWGINWVIKQEQKIRLPILSLTLVWLCYLGINTFQYSKTWYDSLSFWGHVIELYPDHYYAYLSRAKYYSNQRENEAAMADIEHSIEAYGRHYESWYIKGLLLERKGQLEEAVKHYSHSIQLGGPIYKVYLNRGIIKARDYKDAKAAYADFDSSLMVKPDYALAWYNRGISANINGDQKGALNDFDQAIDLEPWNAQYYRNRGLLHYALDDPASALQDFNTLLALTPGAAEIWFFQAEMQAILGDWTGAEASGKQAEKLGYALPEGFWDYVRNKGNPGSP